ncbi:MAG: Carbamoyl phosphate synthase-like protein [Phycisphaerales bacterium]|nr:Carbamoyl phosphate synthase-like protein [Phycisphaerales bacterium]
MSGERRLNVLVLGVGGNVSQGILKALAASRLDCRVIGACVSPMSMGLYTVDRAYLSPQANDPSFLNWLIQTCRAERVDAILSGVEPVLEVLAVHAAWLRAETGALAVVSDPATLAIGNDKLRTCEWLRDHGLHYPHFADAADPAAVAALVERCPFPLIGKPRDGRGGQGVLMIRDRRDLDACVGRAGYVIEEYLGDSASEYTVGCFSDRDGNVRGSIVMWRELLHGTTYRAVVGEFPEVRAEAVRIARALRPAGPCNVQMRMSNGRPTCFEINVRFSGTTAMRAHFGFNDVEAALRHYVLGEPVTDLPHITQGIALRYWDEIYVNPQAVATLEQKGMLNAAREFHARIADRRAES